MSESLGTESGAAEKAPFARAVGGRVNISDRAISDIVGWTVLECYGVVGMAAPNLRQGVAALLSLDRLHQGIKVEQTADQLRLKDVRKLGASLASIGGGGTFNGIVMIGIVAALLAYFSLPETPMWMGSMIRWSRLGWRAGRPRHLLVLGDQVVGKLDLFRLFCGNGDHVLRQPLPHQFIGVVLAHQLAIGAFDFLVGAVPGDAQRFIGVI